MNDQPQFRAGEGESRAARPGEADAFLRVLCASYDLLEAARSIFYADPYFDLSHKRVYHRHELGIVSGLTVLPATLRVGRAWVPLAGIAGVSTCPAQRGRGYATELLSDTVRDVFPELGYPLLGLYANSEPLYRRIGWEVVTCPLRRSVPLAAVAGRLSTASAALCALTPGGLPEEAQRLQEIAAEHQTGNCLRDPRRWLLIERVPGRHYAVFQRPGQPISGYAIWEYFGDTLQILEIVGTEAEAWENLAAFVVSQSSASCLLEWVATREDWERAGLPNNEYVGTAADAGLMLRIGDLEAALSAVHASNFAEPLRRLGRSLTIVAEDPLRPENNRPLRVTAADVVPVSSIDSEWIAGEIGAMAALYLGRWTPSQARRTGQLRASSESALSMADMLFPSRFPMMSPLDFF